MVKPANLYIDNWNEWLDAIAQQGVVVELLAVALCALLAWAGTFAARRSRAVRWRLKQAQAGEGNASAADAAAPAGGVRPSVLLGQRGLQGILFPVLWLLLVFIARFIILHWQPTPVLRVALPVLIALAAIRVGVTVLHATFPRLEVLRALERTVSWVAWIGLVLWISGVWPLTVDYLDHITWRIGSAHVSVLTLLNGTLTAGLLMLLALWLSSVIEARLLRKVSGTQLSVRKVIVNAVRAFMVFIGLLLGLSAAGIDLTALSVLGGAVGVGIGLGLQKLAANYVSGFMVLFERSVRIGDLVRVGGFEGRIADIRARYTVIRSAGGSEAIVPNETMMTSTVENLSLTDPRISQSTTVSVGYNSDVDLVQRLLGEAALEPERVLRDPPPSVLLSGFGADGLDFTVGYWLADPENGLGGPRSQINLAILRKLRAHGVDIPYPQRVLHVRRAAAAPAADAPGGAVDQAPPADSADR